MFKPLFILLVFCSVTVHGQDQKSFIAWNERKLAWKDFQKVDTIIKIVNDSTIVGAESILGIHRSIFVRKDSVFVRVFSFFRPKKSWTIDSSSEGLKHEQLHFDIAEYFSRCLKERIANTRWSSIIQLNDSLKVFHRQISELNSIWQEKYDKETQHKLNKERQCWWEDEIEQKLIAKGKYAYRDLFVFKINQ
jgi:hypothetical protein